MVTLTFLYTPVEKSKSYLEMLFTWKKLENVFTLRVRILFAISQKRPSFSCFLETSYFVALFLGNGIFGNFQRVHF